MKEYKNESKTTITDKPKIDIKNGIMWTLITVSLLAVCVAVGIRIFKMLGN